MSKLKLVPVELTQEMIDEGRGHIHSPQAFGAAPDFDRHVIAVAKIVEALEEMIDVAERVDGWESFPSDPIARAEDAIRGRLKFGDAKNSAPFPSAVVVFHGSKN